MDINNNITESAMLSYKKVFRLIFVFFFLYLMGDAFFRWDGFRYYASFTEFLPSVALVSILWTILAIFAAMIIWLPLLTLQLVCRRVGWKFNVENLLLFILIITLIGVTFWACKGYVFDRGLSSQEKMIFLMCLLSSAIFFTWILRGKLGVVQEKITPLVLLFGTIVILSVPLVIYQTWIKGENNIALSQDTKSTVSDDMSRPNIIFFTFDALAPRNMSVYGHQRPTTPFFDEWSKSASLFNRTIASAGRTHPATASMMTGKRVWTHQRYHSQSNTPPVKGHIENLALELKKSGYYNLAYVVNPVAEIRTLGMIDSFDIAPSPLEFRITSSLIGLIDTTLYKLFANKIKLYNWIIKEKFIFRYVLYKFTSGVSTTAYPPENVFEKFISNMESHSSRPFFVWIHLLPPHDPYLPPEPFMGTYDSSSYLRSETEQTEEILRLNNYTAQANSDTAQEELKLVNIFKARYDEFIQYCDKEFEQFIALLTQQNLLENTVILVSADHGEKITPDYIGHMGVSEPEVHIPLIIKEPDQTKGLIINDLVEQIDITATILDIAKLNIPSWMEGRSLIPLLRGKRLPNKPAFAMDLQTNPGLGHKIANGTIAVWEGDYKLLYDLNKDTSLLFNLKEDPDELNDLFDKETETGHRLLSLIQNNLKQANEKISIVE